MSYAPNWVAYGTVKFGLAALFCSLFEDVEVCVCYLLCIDMYSDESLGNMPKVLGLSTPFVALVVSSFDDPVPMSYEMSVAALDRD